MCFHFIILYFSDELWKLGLRKITLYIHSFAVACLRFEINQWVYLDVIQLKKLNKRQEKKIQCFAFTVPKAKKPMYFIVTHQIRMHINRNLHVTIPARFSICAFFFPRNGLPFSICVYISQLKNMNKISWEHCTTN